MISRVDMRLWITEERMRASSGIHNSLQVYKYIKSKYPEESPADRSRSKMTNQYRQCCESWMNQEHRATVRVNVACGYTGSLRESGPENQLSAKSFIRRLRKNFSNWKTRMKAWTSQRHFRWTSSTGIRWKFKRQPVLSIRRQQEQSEIPAETRRSEIKRRTAPKKKSKSLMNVDHAHEDREPSDAAHRSHHRCVMTMRAELRVDDVALSVERQRLIDLKTFFQDSEFKGEDRVELSSRVWSIAV